MKIFAPVKDFNGIRYNVRFINGVAETNDAKAIEWFRANGYKVPIGEVEPIVEKRDQIADIGNNVDDSGFVDLNKLADEPNFDAMTPEELRNWAKANGYGGVIKNTRDKEKILKLIRG